ncbi:MAG: TRAP transporter small permease subunit [Rhodospirillum sp.]|nr:TRAP transporter small permease subunit [Rhodospirillum sp.]MCF8487674.1 TRAP transporter small permease subunit [Rhodospirillum sp.]MCF8500419.1 TRAP transporter small permease subunit [Rhodospirillum sp.]
MFIRLIDGLNEAIGRVLSIVAILFASIIIYDVVMRYAFNAPSRWAFDISKMLYGFYFVMLGGYALKHRAHVSVDLLLEKLSPNARRWVEIAAYPIFFFPFSWVFTTKSFDFAMRSWNSAESTYGAVQIPVYPLKISMAVAAVLLLLQGVAQMLKLIMNSEMEGENAES